MNCPSKFQIILGKTPAIIEIVSLFVFRLKHTINETQIKNTEKSFFQHGKHKPNARKINYPRIWVPRFQDLSLRRHDYKTNTKSLVVRTNDLMTLY